MKGMRRLDWPDEPGWWWVIGASAGSYPREFTQETIKYTKCMMAPYLEYEGPITEPRTPMRFEIEGTMNPHEQFIGGTTVIYVAKNLIPDEAADKRFKIVFEELC